MGSKHEERRALRKRDKELPACSFFRHGAKANRSGDGTSHSHQKKISLKNVEDLCHSQHKIRDTTESITMGSREPPGGHSNDDQPTTKIVSLNTKQPSPHQVKPPYLCYLHSDFGSTQPSIIPISSRLSETFKSNSSQDLCQKLQCIKPDNAGSHSC